MTLGLVLALGCFDQTNEITYVRVPEYLNVETFDVALRTVGPVLPAFPFFSRTIIRGHLIRRKGRDTLEVGLVYLIVTLVRMIVYAFVKECRCTSDHVFLSMSLSTVLVTEMVLGMYDRRWIDRDGTWGRALWRWSNLCTFQAAFLLILLYVDMYQTARYFHPPLEVAISYVMGIVLFKLPMGLFLHKKETDHRARFHSDRPKRQICFSISSKERPLVSGTVA